jgi:bifunctional non-homologous end joining protein LigD
MLKRSLPLGFIVPAQPVERETPPAGSDWVHEVKHDGYRLIVRKAGVVVRLFTRNGYDWTKRFPAITEAALVEASSFTIDGEAVVVGPDGLSLFDALRRRENARTVILYAFDLIECNGEDFRDRPFLDRKKALSRLLGGSSAGILYNDHVVAEGAVVFEHACKLGAEGIVSKRINAPYRSGPYPAWSRSAIQRASRFSGSAARTGTSARRCGQI